MASALPYKGTNLKLFWPIIESYLKAPCGVNVTLKGNKFEKFWPIIGHVCKPTWFRFNRKRKRIWIESDQSLRVSSISRACVERLSRYRTTSDFCLARKKRQLKKINKQTKIKMVSFIAIETTKSPMFLWNVAITRKVLYQHDLTAVSGSACMTNRRLSIYWKNGWDLLISMLRINILKMTFNRTV